VSTVAAEVLGWVGALALLTGYALLSLGRIPQRRRYQVLNLVGSAGLAVNGLVHQAWPSAILNALWIAIGAAALARLYRLAPRADGGVGARRTAPPGNGGR